MWWIIAIIFLIIIFLGFLATPKGKGIVGEYKVSKILKHLGKTLNGLSFHDFLFIDENSSSQIDNILITEKALYVCEVKNYTGYIFGNETNTNWTSTIKHVNKKTSKSGKVYKKTSVSKHQFYNPIKQNKTHINKIMKLTNINIPIFNIVVFGDNSKIKDVSVVSDKTFVIQKYELSKLINSLDASLSTKINLDTQLDFIDQLYFYNVPGKKARTEHVKSIKDKYKK